MERRDAYSALSLFLSYSSCTVGSEIADCSDRAEDFDIRAEKEFWDEIERGLVLAYNLSPIFRLSTFNCCIAFVLFVS